MTKLRVTLVIDVIDLDKEDRDSLNYGGEADDEGLIPSLSDYVSDGASGASEVASVIENIHSGVCAELFAGSDVYVTFDGAHVESAEWVQE